MLGFEMEKSVHFGGGGIVNLEMELKCGRKWAQFAVISSD